MKRIVFFLLFFCGFSVFAAENLPRFASLRSDEVNMRTGPGERFPISWVYRRMGLPVEILDEFDVWRKVRDSEGTQGWIHKKMLSGKRTALTPKEKEISLYWKHTKSSPTVAILKGALIVEIESCPAGDELCKVQIQGIRGYIDRAYLWGLYAGEVIK